MQPLKRTGVKPVPTEKPNIWCRARVYPGPRRRRAPGAWAVFPLLVILAAAAGAEAATYRDELTFLGKTKYFFREYALVVPLDLKRQTLPGEVHLEIKAWGAWNGSWIPYIYEAIDVPGALPEDLNGIMARYRQVKRETHLDVQKGADNRFALRHEKDGSRFELRANAFTPRVELENPEGRLTLGMSDGELNLKGHQVSGRVVFGMLTPGREAQGSGRYGLYDHFTLQLPSGAVLVIYHSRNRPGYNLATLMTPDAKGDRQGRTVQVAWRNPWSDTETGRSVPAAWTVNAPEIGIKADLEEWGRNVSRYKTDTGKMAIFVSAMVRGSLELDGAKVQVFGLNTHVQDE